MEETSLEKIDLVLEAELPKVEVPKIPTLEVIDLNKFLNLSNLTL